ncbi:MAG: branched-chain amino acid ABC transporter permease [Anaerolineae bacterium]|nr:branched-chain amino acid ABC transporter permease [Anaerolineae bacterium]MDD5667534.1 branched-chain amino acid ABC transporter permease [Actinomycetota bacterium]
MPSSFEIFQAIVSGILLGGVYAVLGVGFGLAWGVMDVINLSHAAFALLATYIAYWANNALHLDPLLSLLISVPLFFLVGIVLYRVIIKVMAKKAQDLVAASLVLTFGLAIILENSMQYIWKPDPRTITLGYTGKSFFIANVSIPYTSLIGFILALVTAACIYLFLHRTFLGKAVRAVWQDKEGAALCGINLDRVSAVTFGMSLAAAAAGGVCMSIIYSFNPSTHFIWLIYIFIVVIVGGVGSVAGTVVAGILIGLIANLSAVFIPYAWVNMVLFGILVAILLARPKGLFAH